MELDEHGNEQRPQNPGRIWQMTLTTEGGAFLDEIETLVQMVGLDQIAPRRHSALFALSIFGEFKAGRLNPFRLKQEITALECGTSTGLKAPTQFRHQPLQGLWHKHYMQTDLRSMALNVQRGLKEFGSPHMQEMVREAKEAGEARYFEPKHIPSIVQDVIQGNWERLKSDENLTGEWIIFAKHDGENYYLALATHEKSTHEAVRHQIDAICCREFPFLTDLLSSSNASDHQTD